MSIMILIGVIVILAVFVIARYNKLVELLARKKQFSAKDVLENQDRVKARWNNPGRGMANPIPNRTIWTDLYDQKSGTLKVKFYLKDGPLDPMTGDPKDLVWSDFFTFKLQKEKLPER